MEVGCFNSGRTPMGSLTRQILSGRFFMIFAAIMILSLMGTTYIFGLYSNEIKSALGYDQTTLNLLSFFKDLGTAVGIHAGLIMEVTHPWVVLTIGAVINFFGYFMIWLAVIHRISPPVWQMCLYICIGANAIGFANTGTLVTCVKNFPENRGIVIGLLKSYIGLGGAVLTQLYHAIYGNDSKSLILLIAWLPAAVSLAFVGNIRVLKSVTPTKRESKFFYDILYISLALAGFILAMIMVEQHVHAFPRAGYGGSTVVVLTLMFLPVLIVLREEYFLWKKKQENLRDSNETVQVKVAAKDVSTSEDVPPPPTMKNSPDSSNTSCFRDVFRPPARGEDYSILQALFSIDMLLLFLTATSAIGGTLTAIDNLGQIGTSLGYPTKTITTFVSLVAIWQYLGRVMGGLISEQLLARYKWPRPLCLTLTLLLSCIGHLLIAFNVRNGLYVASIIIGFCFGAEWTLLYSIISELFGLKYYATLYNFGSIASPIGGYILNVRVTGHLYDREGKRQLAALGLTRKAGKELNCNGVECYRLAFIIITVATLACTLVSLALVVRTRSFYKGDIYRKFRDESTRESETEMAAAASTN